MRAGIDGFCGDSCPVFLEGECPEVKKEEEDREKLVDLILRQESLTD